MAVIPGMGRLRLGYQEELVGEMEAKVRGEVCAMRLRGGKNRTELN